MAYQFTRPNNDLTDTLAFNKSNNDYYQYTSDTTFGENKNFCYSNVGLPNAQSQISRPMTQEGMMDLGIKTDIETRVQNRHKELNSSERNNKDYEKFSVQSPGICGTKETMTSEDSRFTNPIVNYREMNTSNYIINPYMFVNVQAAVVDNTLFLPPTRNGESSRFDAKKAKYDLKPKEFATSKPESYYENIYSGLLPVKQVVKPAYDYTGK
jgi:hypothetical protein